MSYLNPYTIYSQYNNLSLFDVMKYIKPLHSCYYIIYMKVENINYFILNKNMLLLNSLYKYIYLYTNNSIHFSNTFQFIIKVIEN